MGNVSGVYRGVGGGRWEPLKEVYLFTWSLTICLCLNPLSKTPAETLSQDTHGELSPAIGGSSEVAREPNGEVGVD